MGLIFLPLMFLALWAIVILPQQRRMRAHRALVSVLQEGDEVMTTSGILGTITAIDDEVLHLAGNPAAHRARRHRPTDERTGPRTRTGTGTRRRARRRAGRGRAVRY
jgi:preprotein translocase YajC subunit